MDAFAAFVTRRPLLILFLVGVATLAAAASLVDPTTGNMRLQIDSSIDSRTRDRPRTERVKE